MTKLSDTPKDIYKSFITTQGSAAKARKQHGLGALIVFFLTPLLPLQVEISCDLAASQEVLKCEHRHSAREVHLKGTWAESNRINKGWQEPSSELISTTSHTGMRSRVASSHIAHSITALMPKTPGLQLAGGGQTDQCWSSTMAGQPLDFPDSPSAYFLWHFLICFVEGFPWRGDSEAKISEHSVPITGLGCSWRAVRVPPGAQGRVGSR